MTSASGLFTSRRSRSTRTPEDLLPPEPDPHRPPSRRHCRTRLRHRSNASSRSHLCQEVELHLTDNVGATESGTSSRIQREVNSVRTTGLNFNRNERLPGTVLQARARLLERLRGVSLTGSGQRTTASHISWNEFAASDDFRVNASGDVESEGPIEWFEFVSPFADSVFQESLPSSQHARKKPPGLEWDAVNGLQREVFIESDADPTTSVECSICLEKFCEGDGLIHLPCSHKFHPICLVPWIRTCGDCPYCRTVVTV